MAHTRLFIASDLAAGQSLELDADRARYIGRVLRLRAGDVLSVFNGEQGEFEATVERITKHGAVVRTGKSIEVDVESSLRLHLVQGISRGERMDFVVQKATELGVKRISPVLTAHGMVKLEAARAAKRREHWQRVAESACEQSGRVRPPLIDPPLPLPDWLGARTERADLDVVLQPGRSQPLASLPRPATKLCLLIGPEGGFSELEIDAAVAAGFTAAALGPRILRTETAAVATLAAAQVLWGDLGALPRQFDAGRKD